MQEFSGRKQLIVFLFLVFFLLLIIAQACIYFKIYPTISIILSIAYAFGLYLCFFVLYQNKQSSSPQTSQRQLLQKQFLSRLGHTLRTPLTAIMGFTEILFTKKMGPLTQEQENLLDTIKMNSTLLLSLIDSAMDIINLDSGTFIINNEKIDCQFLLNHVVNLKLSQAEKKNIHITLQLPEEKIYVMSDNKILGKILLNLLNNAIEFTEKGEIKIQLITKTNPQGKEVISIDVIDSGIGISTENQSKIFRPFEQVSSPENRTAGLGLYVVKKFADVINCEIVFKSEAGKGSCFSLVLPANCR